MSDSAFPTSRLIVRCPAKVNLFLAVGPRDERGYHPLRTVFQAVSLSDDLSIEVADRDRFDSNVPLPERNTVTKAWSLLREVLPLPPLRVRLTKRIPSQAGLGGGSSDAAGMIRGAQRLVGASIPKGELNGLALAVGADVPFFIVGGRARAEGYGERLTPLPDEPDEPLVIVKPTVGCPTDEMYRRLDEKPCDLRPFPGYDVLSNDFERVAPMECLDLIRKLKAYGARDAALSGSGSAVFGRFVGTAEAQEAVRRIEAESSHFVYLVHTLSRSESTLVVP